MATVTYTSGLNRILVDDKPVVGGEITIDYDTSGETRHALDETGRSLVDVLRGTVLAIAQYKQHLLDSAEIPHFGGSEAIDEMERLSGNYERAFSSLVIHFRFIPNKPGGLA